jgi:hypothetical protein
VLAIPDPAVPQRSHLVVHQLNTRTSRGQITMVSDGI